MSSQTSTLARNNFNDMTADAVYCGEVQKTLYDSFGVRASVYAYSTGILKVDDGSSTFHVVCIDEVKPTREELAGERFGIDRDRVFYFRSPHTVSCTIVTKREEKMQLRQDVTSHLQNNIEVQLPSYSLPVQVKGYF